MQEYDDRYWREQRRREKEAVAKVPEEKKEAAAGFLRGLFTEEQKNQLREMMEGATDHFWVAKIIDTRIFPIGFHTLGGGMAIRNTLRQHGFGEKELGIENLDYIYARLLERAILGKEIEE